MKQNLQKMELRHLDFSNLQFDDAEMKVTGYVNKTGQVSALLGEGENRFHEIMEPGVFNSALGRASSVDFLLEHEPANVLSSTSNDTLSLTEDEDGLFMSAKIMSTSVGRDAYELIKENLISGMSFGMQVLEDSWSLDATGFPLRKVKKINLFEVSAVRFPAYSSSMLEARGIKEIDIQVPEIRAKENDSLNNEQFNDKLDALITSVSQLVECLSGDNEDRAKKNSTSFAETVIKPAKRDKDSEKEAEKGTEDEKPVKEPVKPVKEDKQSTDGSKDTEKVEDRDDEPVDPEPVPEPDNEPIETDSKQCTQDKDKEKRSLESKNLMAFFDGKEVD